MKPANVVFVAFLALSPCFARADDFARFVDDYFVSRFTDHPSDGTAAGLHQYDSALEDLSRETVQARIAELKRQLARLTSFPAGVLSAADAIDARFLEGQIRGELLDLETLRLWEINPMPYVSLPGGAVDGLIKRDFAPPQERLRLVIARERAIPAIHAAAKTNVKNPPKEFTDLATRMTKGSIGFFEGSVATWAKTAAGQDSAAPQGV